jgi:hypothetical protein
MHMRGRYLLEHISQLKSDQLDQIQIHKELFYD